VHVFCLLVPPNHDQKSSLTAKENCTLPCTQNSTKIATTPLAEINGVPPKKMLFSLYVLCNHNIASPIMTVDSSCEKIFFFFFLVFHYLPPKCLSHVISIGDVDIEQVLVGALDGDDAAEAGEVMQDLDLAPHVIHVLRGQQLSLGDGLCRPATCLCIGKACSFLSYCRTLSSRKYSCVCDFGIFYFSL
jgi:hypothetical protein